MQEDPFAKEMNIVHIIINAYGVQSPDWMKLIRAAIDTGRVDAIIQSTDKNFLTPVGGAIIASPNVENISKISQTYAGRASATPIGNFLISSLSLGLNGYKKLITDRIKDEVNKWIDEIKSKSPDLLLTKQWKIISRQIGWLPLTVLPQPE